MNTKNYEITVIVPKEIQGLELVIKEAAISEMADVVKINKEKTTEEQLMEVCGKVAHDFGISVAKNGNKIIFYEGISELDALKIIMD